MEHIRAIQPIRLFGIPYTLLVERNALIPSPATNWYMITRIATASEYETSEAARHVAELQNVLLQMPPAQQAMGFAILSLVQETAATSTATVENADEIWRAARLFRQFLKLSKAGKAIVEVAIAFVDIHHLGWMSSWIIAQ